VERSVRIRDSSVESWEPRIGIAAATARFRYLRRRRQFLIFDLLFLVCLLSGVLAKSAVGVLLRQSASARASPRSCTSAEYPWTDPRRRSSPPKRSTSFAGGSSDLSSEEQRAFARTAI
jgi:hypothetical protein